MYILLSHQYNTGKFKTEELQAVLRQRRQKEDSLTSYENSTEEDSASDNVTYYPGELPGKSCKCMIVIVFLIVNSKLVINIILSNAPKSHLVPYVCHPPRTLLAQLASVAILEI